MAERLASLTLDHGVSGFLFFTDSPDDLRLLATETAPATRELVAAERSRRTATGA